MRDIDGKSKCFVFVNYENADDAAKAVDDLNGQMFDDKEWYVGRAQKKSEREAELKQRLEQSLKEAVDKYQGTKLQKSYVAYLLQSESEGHDKNDKKRGDWSADWGRESVGIFHELSCQF